MRKTFLGLGLYVCIVITLIFILRIGFTEFALTNRWSNLFVDRSAQVAAISDEAIDAYVAHDNYSRLVQRMRITEGFRGWRPDLAGLELGRTAFGEDGIARVGSSWVAFNYMPIRARSGRRTARRTT